MRDTKGTQSLGWLSTIRSRLYLAFGFAAALTIIGSSIAFYEFTVIGLTTKEIVSRSLPTTAAVAAPRRTSKQLWSFFRPAPMAAGTDTKLAAKSWTTSVNKKKVWKTE